MFSFCKISIPASNHKWFSELQNNENIRVVHAAISIFLLMKEKSKQMILILKMRETKK